MPTGDVEVLVDNVEVLNQASQDLPFSTADLSVPVSCLYECSRLSVWSECVHACVYVHVCVIMFEV